MRAWPRASLPADSGPHWRPEAQKPPSSLFSERDANSGSWRRWACPGACRPGFIFGCLLRFQSLVLLQFRPQIAPGLAAHCPRLLGACGWARRHWSISHGRAPNRMLPAMLQLSCEVLNRQAAYVLGLRVSASSVQCSDPLDLFSPSRLKPQGRSTFRRKKATSTSASSQHKQRKQCKRRIDTADVDGRAQ